jgi:single-stranded DNA-binding protein
VNAVFLKGSLTRDPKTGAGAKGSYGFFSLRPDGGKSIIECVAYGACADQLADLHSGDAVKVTGRIGASKDKKLTEAAQRDVWLQNVTIDAEQGGKIEVPAKAASVGGASEDEIGF